MLLRNKKIDPQKLGITLHELIVREVFRFLEHRAGKESLKHFNLDYKGLGNELTWLGHFAAWSILKKSFPEGNEDVMALMQEAYYNELRKAGVKGSELTELDSYLRKRFLTLSVAEAKLSEDKFSEELGKMSAISVSESDPPPEGLSAVFLIYYNVVGHRLSEFLYGVQLEDDRKESFDDIAAGLAVQIFKEATSCANSVDEFSKEFSKKENGTKSEIYCPQYTQLVLEFIFLFVHLTDRIAFGVFGLERRAHFMDSLAFWINKIMEDATLYFSPKFKKEMSVGEKIRVSNHYRTLLATKGHEFLETIMMGSFDHEELNARSSEYSNYKKLFPEENESYKNTLFWEFGKHVSEVVTGHPTDITYITFAIRLAVNSVKNLDVQEKLKRA